jgi:hypothetical protein
MSKIARCSNFHENYEPWGETMGIEGRPLTSADACGVGAPIKVGAKSAKIVAEDFCRGFDCCGGPGAGGFD